jgi:hypothetical protein
VNQEESYGGGATGVPLGRDVEKDGEEGHGVRMRECQSSGDGHGGWCERGR